MRVYLCGDTAHDLNNEHQGQAEHGQWQEGGHSERSRNGICGEYSTISRENNVCNNSREIKDFIKKYSDPVLPHCLIQNPPLRFKLQVSKKIKAFL